MSHIGLMRCLVFHYLPQYFKLTMQLFIQLLLHPLGVPGPVLDRGHMIWGLPHGMLHLLQKECSPTVLYDKAMMLAGI